MLNLDEFEGAARAHEDGIAVEIVHPVTGEPTGAVLTVCGPDSRRARIARTAAIRKALLASNADDLTDEAGADAATDMLARCVLAWEGINRGDEAVPLTRENAVAVFKRFPWIEAQVDRKVSDRANFTNG